MNKNSFKTAALIVFMIFMAFNTESIICQVKQDTIKKSQQKPKSVTAEQTQQIKKILSAYNSSTLTAEQAREIQSKFREAGIHAGPETKDAITAAGFDDEKLRKLSPPPYAGNKTPGQSPIDERLRIINDKICTPLSLTATQKETVIKAFREFYTEIDKLNKAQVNKQEQPDKSKVDPLEKTRDEKIKLAVSCEQFIKYLELEKAARPKREKGNDQK